MTAPTDPPADRLAWELLAKLSGPDAEKIAQRGDDLYADWSRWYRNVKKARQLIADRVSKKARKPNVKR